MQNYKYQIPKNNNKREINYKETYLKNSFNKAKNLYAPKNIDKTKSKYRLNTNNLYQNTNNATSSKNYLKFKQLLNNYMNDYQKLKKQKLIPKVIEKEYTFQEFEIKKNNMKNILDNFMNLNIEDELEETNYLIENIESDSNEILLKNDFTKKDYEIRYNYINKEKNIVSQKKEINKKNIDKKDNNINQRYIEENKEEEEEAEYEEFNNKD